MFGYQPLQPFGGNPYQDQLARMQMQPQSVTRVSGIDSARQLRLPPNSSMFALDYDDQHVYAVFTDGAGDTLAFFADAATSVTTAAAIVEKVA